MLDAAAEAPFHGDTGESILKLKTDEPLQRLTHEVCGAIAYELKLILVYSVKSLY
jgi:hypothetical protein